MFGKRITLFKLLGFAVHVDLSWIILALLVTWSLAAGVFPHALPGLSPAAYWGMGVAGAAGLFLSIIFHELFHSLVARRFGLPMKGITLFIFGGVAEMDEEPPGPKAEFFMAVVGPLSSVALAAVFYLTAGIVGAAGETVPVAAVLGYLATINMVLAIFNLLPAFPLDGGRMLRSLLWRWKNNLRWATRVASRIGSWFGLAIIFFGIVNVIIGNFVGGIWQFMIGMFLRTAAEMSYQQVVVRRALEGATVAQFMNRDPVTAPSSLTVRELVEDLVYQYHHKMFPVTDGGRVLGCITTRRVKEIPRAEWDRKTVGDIADKCSVGNTIGPGVDALKALSLMNRTGNSRLMVMDGDRLVGVISLKDIMGYLSVKMDLEDERD
jgi:Zn-dependent protease